jgi:hypothetical protein
MTKSKTPRTEQEALADLTEMLTYCRPEGSKHQQKFINRFLRPLGIERDTAGNVIKVIATSKVLWSSHTDTVHRSDGRQEVSFKGDDIKLKHNSKSSCLGADCTTGVWLMREMILAGVPGVYIFHAGEECGGVGSRHIQRKTPALIEGLDFAIAFDRMFFTSIITHQAGGRCCSDEFAASLNIALGGGYKTDTGGSFTDTANYTGLIGECTNLSVGYIGQHTSRETQNWKYALLLRKRLLAFDESLLVSKRKPGEEEPRRFTSWARGWADNEDSFVRPRPAWARRSTLPSLWDEGSERRGGGSRAESNASKLERLIRYNPTAVADFLEAEGYDHEEISDWIMDAFGVVNH